MSLKSSRNALFDFSDANNYGFTYASRIVEKNKRIQNQKKHFASKHSDSVCSKSNEKFFSNLNEDFPALPASSSPNVNFIERSDKYPNLLEGNENDDSFKSGNCEPDTSDKNDSYISKDRFLNNIYSQNAEGAPKILHRGPLGATHSKPNTWEENPDQKWQPKKNIFYENVPSYAKSVQMKTKTEQSSVGNLEKGKYVTDGQAKKNYSKILQTANSSLQEKILIQRVNSGKYNVTSLSCENTAKSSRCDQPKCFLSKTRKFGNTSEKSKFPRNDHEKQDLPMNHKDTVPKFKINETSVNDASRNNDFSSKRTVAKNKGSRKTNHKAISSENQKSEKDISNIQSSPKIIPKVKEAKGNIKINPENETPGASKKKKKKRPSKLKRQAALLSGKVVVISAEVSAKLEAANNENNSKHNSKIFVDLSSASDFPELTASTPKSTISKKGQVSSAVKAEKEDSNNSENSVSLSGSQEDRKTGEKESENKTKMVKLKVLTGSNPEGSYVDVHIDSLREEHKENLQSSPSSPAKSAVKENSKVKPCPRDPISLCDLLVTSEKKKEKKKNDIEDKPLIRKPMTVKKMLNVLDSSSPAVKRGKEREKPKQKRPSQLKKIILKERAQKKETMKNLMVGAEQYLKDYSNNGGSTSNQALGLHCTVKSGIDKTSNTVNNYSITPAETKIVEEKELPNTASLDSITSVQQLGQRLIDLLRESYISPPVSDNSTKFPPNLLDASMDAASKELNGSSSSGGFNSNESAECSENEENQENVAENQKTSCETSHYSPSGTEQATEVSSLVKIPSDQASPLKYSPEEKSTSELPNKITSCNSSSFESSDSCESFLNISHYNEVDTFNIKSTLKSCLDQTISVRNGNENVESGDSSSESSKCFNNSHQVNQNPLLKAENNCYLQELSDLNLEEDKQISNEIVEDASGSLTNDNNSVSYIFNKHLTTEENVQDITAEDRNKAVKIALHTKNFREYCDHLLSKTLDENVQLLLEDLTRFQDRTHQKDPVKARMKRRLVYGIKEVTKNVKLKKLKCVLIAPNVENIQSEGGLNDALGNLIKVAAEYDVPYIFTLERKQLGKFCKKPVPISCAGIFNYEGSEMKFKTVMELYEESIKDYRELYNIILENIDEDDILKLLDVSEKVPSMLLTLRSRVIRSIFSKRSGDSKLELSPEFQKFVTKYMMKI